MEQLTVIKIGGNIVDNESALDQFLSDFSSIKGHKVLVHGGGKIATRIGKEMGIQPNMVNGRRVTDKETIDLVTMVYGGLVNKKIVAKLQALSCNAIGFTGVDGNVIRSVKRPVKDIDYGFVGDVQQVDGAFLTTILKSNRQPVMAPLTHDAAGQMLNTNADTIASSLAVALSAYFETQLIYCFELPGVMRDISDDSSVISKINKSDYNALRESGVIVSGMIPKMDNCFDAISNGVKQVRIAQASDLKSILIHSEEKGTTLTS